LNGFLSLLTLVNRPSAPRSVQRPIAGFLTWLRLRTSLLPYLLPVFLAILPSLAWGPPTVIPVPPLGLPRALAALEGQLREVAGVMLRDSCLPLLLFSLPLLLLSRRRSPSVYLKASCHIGVISQHEQNLGGGGGPLIRSLP
jgi:hypothetical protein